jgi:succinate-semialdehyde dehydrogenase/glutarate-semialdehyde dehydrogenase
MSFQVINPATGETLKEIPVWDDATVEAALSQVADATPAWASTPIAERCALMRKAAQVLRDNKDNYARLITTEMGKLITDARAEVEKCALVCDYYAEYGPEFLQDEAIASDAGKSFVAYLPLGTVLAVMPWNFPFWQVFRFAAPALVAGNTGLLKHASNVPESALAIEAVFREAGFPQGVFRTLMIRASQVQKVIEDPRVHAVTLTGSEPAGRQVAATAGTNLKKTVLELGGSDAFIVLEDADLDEAVKVAVTSRFLNTGQSCIAAKRFIVVDAIAEDFVARFKAVTEALQPGDPMNEATTLAPMARTDLRDDLHQQVRDSIAAGAVAVTGCEPVEGTGAYYLPSILDRVEPGMRAYGEELFGPVAIVIRARDENDALRIANDSPYGLGGSIWTRDTARGERLARQMQSGATFINGLVKSDPRLPFGGVKNSGYGRELSHHGMHEFVNAKTIWIK